MTGRLEGKVAVITGAASGIGAESARLFAAEGASVVLADVQDDRGQRIADELGGNARFIHTDVTDDAQVGAAVQFAVDTFGRLDVMFNNAGRGHPEGLISDLKPEMYRESVDVLLGGVLFGIKHASAVMKAQKSGSIINTASVAGIGVGLGAATLMLHSRPVRADEPLAEDLRAAIRRWSGQGLPRTGRVHIDISPLIENGHAVPVTLKVDSPMTDADHVREIVLFNERNPQRDVVRC